jgi:hypothetical protein
MAGEAGNDDAAMEAEKQRLQMAAVLYRALRGAEGDLANARPRSRADLAGACHSKLQYDFPIVNAAEVDALVEEMATEIAEGTTPGSMVYPVTAALVNAAVEGACKPAPGTGAAPGISGKSNGDERKEDAGAGGVGDEPAVDRGAVRTAYQRLCATTLVYFTSRVLAMPDEEADDALRGYRVEVETAPALVKEDPADDCEDRQEPPGESSAVDASDSDSDWEPMETDQRIAPTSTDDDAADGILGAMPPEARVDAKLAHLLSRLSRACVDGDDVWDTPPNASLPPLASALVSLTETLARCEGRPARRAMRSAPLRVLRETWALPKGPPPRSDDSVARLLSALGFESKRKGGGVGGAMARLGLDDGARGGDEDVGLALEFLAFLCVRLGGEALGDFASAASSSAGKPPKGFGVGAAGHLWGHVDAHIDVVAEKFDTLAHVKAVGDNAWQQRIGMCSLVVAFHAAKAPGNADPGGVLTRTGALRAMCAAFTAPDNAVAPHSEALRRAVLLVASAAPKTGEFLASVPGVRSEVETRDEFQPEGSLAAHGALWELLLPAKGTSPDDAERLCAERLAPLLDPKRRAVSGGLVAGASLGLLRAVQTAGRGRGPSPLWRRGGAIDGVLRDALTSLATTVSAGARARGMDKSSRPKKAAGSDDEGEDDDGGEAAAASDPELEKSREMASAALRVLKEILGAADGGGGRKCD